MSLAVQVTVVVPIGNVLPLGGLQLINGGGLQPPLAVLVKNTVAPPDPLAVTVMFDEQLMLIGGLTTVTVKLQLVLLPQVSLAVVSTVVVPTGNVLPLGGLAVTKGGGLQPPLAVTVKNTVAPLELVAVTVMFDAQFSTIGGLVFVTELTITLADAELLTKLVSPGVATVMTAELSHVPALVA